VPAWSINDQANDEIPIPEHAAFIAIIAVLPDSNNPFP